MSYLLAIDIGNTNIVVGVFREAALLFDVRLQTDLGRTIDEYAALLVTLLDRELGPSCHVDRAIISSVVPPLTGDMKALIERRFKLHPLIVSHRLDLGIGINVVDPTSVGADRLVNAVAANALFGAPAIVVDFGTATTFDVVGATGAYEGGVISPGIGVALDSLVSRTSKLPRIELEWPQSVIGKTTVEAMQSGTVVGYVAMVDGLIDRILAELQASATVIATGGFGEICTKHSSKISSYEPHLTLYGMRLIAERNRSGNKDT